MVPTKKTNNAGNASQLTRDEHQKVLRAGNASKLTRDEHQKVLRAGNASNLTRGEHQKVLRAGNASKLTRDEHQKVLRAGNASKLTRDEHQNVLRAGNASKLKVPCVVALLLSSITLTAAASEVRIFERDVTTFKVFSTTKWLGISIFEERGGTITIDEGGFLYKKSDSAGNCVIRFDLDMISDPHQKDRHKAPTSGIVKFDCRVKKCRGNYLAEAHLQKFPHQREFPRMRRVRAMQTKNLRFEIETRYRITTKNGRRRHSAHVDAIADAEVTIRAIQDAKNKAKEIKAAVEKEKEIKAAVEKEKEIKAAVEKEKEIKAAVEKEKAAFLRRMGVVAPSTVAVEIKAAVEKEKEIKAAVEKEKEIKTDVEKENETRRLRRRLCLNQH